MKIWVEFTDSNLSRFFVLDHDTTIYSPIKGFISFNTDDKKLIHLNKRFIRSIEELER